MKYEKIWRVSLLILDILLFFLSLYLALFFRKGEVPSLEFYLLFVKNFLFLFCLWTFFLFVFDFYSFRHRPGEIEFFRSFLIFTSLCFFTGIFYFYFSPDLSIAPKTILFLQILTFSLLFLFCRTIFDFIFKKALRKERVLILGSAEELKELITFVKKHFFPFEIKVKGGISSEKDLFDFLKKEKIERVIICNDAVDIKRILINFPEIKIESFGNFYEKILKKVPFSALKDSRFLESFYKEEEKTYLLLKRAFDIFFALLGGIVFIFLFPLIAFLIKIDSPGPIFFIQERVGKNRKIFKSIKFRSMVSSPQKEENEVWREKNKKEVTRIGKILRFTHLDELPQFLNILKGEMSFVGPRPEWKKLADRFEKEIPFYSLRYRVKPGFTGWAQINYPPSRSVEEAKEKLQYDLYYIRHRSFLFDLIIFLKTLRKLFG